MKKSNQKAKLLYLYDYLKENSDIDHPVTVRQMINHLDACGIAAERKSIYSDLEILQEFGIDIVRTKSKQTGYFIGERKFEYAELLLLADAVQSSRFITAKKSEQLIKKLRNLASKYQAQSIARSIVVSNRVKTMNESIYYIVDAIASAMDEKRIIRFDYFSWNSEKQKVLKNNGEKYSIVPVDLIWSDQNFYLVGYDLKTEMKKHFRVDKMNKIVLGDTYSEKDFEEIRYNSDDYSEKVFGMYGGRSERVTVLCEESLAGVFIDRFGKDIVLRKREGGFETTVNVEISPVFLSWIISFGDKAKVISPAGVIDEIKKLALDATKNY